MRCPHFTLAFALLAAAALAACSHGRPDGPDRPAFRAQINFGDSLSDVGTYAVGAIAGLGGGKFTINGDATARDPALTGKIWTELMAAKLDLPPPCPAQTGLEGDPAQGLRVPVVNHPRCFGYAQGGSRVTHPIGAGNARTGSAVGALTLPVAGQVANHLAAAGGSFRGDELVFVMAGANDVLMQAAAPAPEAVAAVATAADELAALVRKQILGRGANYVVVVNVGDIASTPHGRSQPPRERALIKTMVSTFNTRLKAGVAGDSRVVYVDFFSLVRDQVA
ncbi:MAG: outer rane lipase/esterase, partial [Massilia sp.]